MALRIRHGLSTDRVTITPELGEILYDTDTKLVYIGDGVTLGGTPVGGGTFTGTSDDITEGTVHLFLTTAEKAVLDSISSLSIAYAVAL